MRELDPHEAPNPRVKEPEAPDTAADARFETAHLRQGLGHRTLRGGTITLASQAAKFVIGLGSTMILARLLAPADFGVIAKIYVFIGAAEIMKDLGLSMASVQREKLTHRVASSLFWINAAAGAVMGTVLAASAPWIARLYDDPRLVPVVAAFGIMFFMGGLSAQHQALLQRQMRFSSLAGIEIGSRLIGAGSALGLGALGFGYWALVANLVVYAVAFALIVWPMTRWIPTRPSRGNELGAMVRFGMRLTAINLLNHLVSSVDKFVVGRFGGDYVTGLYDRAGQLLLQPLRQINVPMTTVAVPALSRIHSDRERFARVYLRAIKLIMTVTAPLFVFMFLWAEQIVVLMLGPQWVAAADLFRIFAVLGLTRPLASTTGWLYITTGRVQEMLRWRLQSLWVTPLSVPVAMYFGGVTGVAMTVAAIGLVLTVPAVWAAQRGTGIGTWRIVRTAAQPTLAALASGALVWPMLETVPMAASMAAMPLLYVLLSCAMAWSFAPVREIWDLRSALVRERTA